MDHESESGLAGVAGRAALFPARAAARLWRDQLETAVDEVLAAPEVARLVDSALAGPLPEAVTRAIVRHRVVERVAAELASSGELERLVTEALASPRTVELTDRILASQAMQLALRRWASSPELREALRTQSRGLAEEVVEALRGRAVRLDDRSEEIVRRRPRLARSAYGGIATRALALATDVIVAGVLYMAAVGIAAIVASLVGGLRPEWLVGVLLASGWALVSATYFVLFWSTAGQTPGMRLFHLRVRAGAGPPSLGRSAVRVVGLMLAIAPMFLGFLPVLFDERRRGLADFLAGTVVVYEDAT